MRAKVSAVEPCARFDKLSFRDIALLRLMSQLRGSKGMERQVRIEIKGKDEFWVRAFHVEWNHQFPDRQLAPDIESYFLAAAEWLADLERVAAETFCTITRAPDSPQRRRWLSSIIPRRDRD